MVKRVLNVEDISISEALKILEEKIVSKGVTGDIVEKTLDYLRKFSKINAEKARELVGELIKRFGLTRITAIQIVNIMPKSIDELRTLLGVERREFSDKDLEEMLELLKKYMG